MSDELYISFLFPPANFVSGITVSKRIVENNSNVDVLQVKTKNQIDEFNQMIDEHVDERIIVELYNDNDSLEGIFEFVEMGLKSINRDYEKIYSRSWFMANHFLAFEYKFLNPEVYWKAEFSDPLRLTMKNNVKNFPQMKITDERYIKKLNNKITDFNEKNHADFPLIENPTYAYFIAEYMVYLFADEIIFTNANQREVMLERFPIDIKNIVLDKSVISPHPTLPNEFYHADEVDLDLDDNCINIAYFGNDYYGSRHFEGIYYALNTLKHKHIDKIKFYLFINDKSLLKTLTNDFDNVIIKKPLGYLEFLNATTEFDVLLVNDADTSKYFDKNPYLPSKLSDYLGSNSDIWAIYEKGSSLSQTGVKYMSLINDYSDIRSTLIEILEDNGYCDDDYSFDDSYIAKRFTDLNVIIEKEHLRKNKFKNKFEAEKEKNKKSSSSDSKINKFFKSLKK